MLDPAQVLTAITVDRTAPALSNPSSVGTTADTTPDFSFTTNEAGDIAYTGGCSSTDSEATVGENTVTFDALSGGTHECTMTITDAAGNVSDVFTIPSFTVDLTAPTLSSPSSIGTTADSTPSFTFTSDEAGTISYAGSCSSAVTEATNGENIVVFDAISDGVYSDCALTVTDAVGNESDSLSVPSFTVDTTASMIDTEALISSNDNAKYAKVGDTLTLTFTVSEALQTTPTATIAGESVTVTADGTTYTATYTVTATTPETMVTYDIGELTDTAGNTFDPAENTVMVTIDRTVPQLSDPSSIGTTNDGTPDFSFTSNETGTVTYTGTCSSADTEATNGVKHHNL